MALPQISKAIRNEFREVLSGHFVLRDISDIVTAAGFSDDVTWEAWGNRRKLAEDYFATLNLARQRDIAMLLAAVNKTAVRLTADGIPEGISDLIRLMRENGYSYEDGTFTAVQQQKAVTEELMMWSLSTYNFICYGSPDALVFRDGVAPL